jgi:putative membrane protein
MSRTAPATSISGMTTILSYTGCGPGCGGGPGWWILVPIAFWLLAIAAVVSWRRRWGGRPGAESALGEAFARGEITEAEYRSRLAVLRETARR